MIIYLKRIPSRITFYEFTPFISYFERQWVSVKQSEQHTSRVNKIEWYCHFLVKKGLPIPHTHWRGGISILLSWWAKRVLKWIGPWKPFKTSRHELKLFDKKAQLRENSLIREPSKRINVKSFSKLWKSHTQLRL